HDQRVAADHDLASVDELSRRRRAAGLRPQILHPRFVGLFELLEELANGIETDGIAEFGKVAAGHGWKRRIDQRSSLRIQHENERVEKDERRRRILDLLEGLVLARGCQQFRRHPDTLLDERLLDLDAEASTADDEGLAARSRDLADVGALP